MRFVKIVIALVCVAAQANACIAGLIIQPVPVADETARFDRGRPAITVRRDHGAIQVRPRELDHGSIAFDIAVFNNGDAPANFDTANVEAKANGAAIRPFTVTELTKKAKSRAFWTQMAVAMVAGAAAGLSASQRDTYSNTLYTPHGVYRGYYSRPSVSGQIAAAGSVVAGGVAISRIEDQLRATLDNMQDNVIQVTTIDPGDSYAGMVVLQKIKGQKAGQRVDMAVNWNGEIYPFAFQVVKDGTPMPVFAALSTAAQDATPMPHAASSAPIATTDQAPPATFDARASETVPVSEKALPVSPL